MGEPSALRIRRPPGPRRGGAGRPRASWGAVVTVAIVGVGETTPSRRDPRGARGLRSPRTATVVSGAWWGFAVTPPREGAAGNRVGARGDPRFVITIVRVSPRRAALVSGMALALAACASPSEIPPADTLVETIWVDLADDADEAVA